MALEIKDYSTADLFLLGAGVLFPEHLTIEIIDVLNKCKKIYTNLPESKLTNLPDEIKQKTESIWHLYKNNRLRSENYQDVINTLLSGLDFEKPIAWLTPGHPTVFDSVSSALLREAPLRNCQVAVLPAISCFDTILADLGYEPANGLFMYEITSLVKRNIPLNPQIGNMLLQPSVFLSNRAHLTLDTIKPDFGPLKEYLLKFYPGNHICGFVVSSIGKTRSQIFWISINEIENTPNEYLGNSTLWIPSI